MESKIFWRDFVLSTPLALVWTLTGFLLGIAYSAVHFALAPALQGSEVIGAAVGAGITLIGAEVLRLRAKRSECRPLAQEIFEAALALQKALNMLLADIDATSEKPLVDRGRITLKNYQVTAVIARRAIDNLQSLDDFAKTTDLILARRLQRLNTILIKGISNNSERVDQMGFLLNTFDVHPNEKGVENCILDIRRSLKMWTLVCMSVVDLTRSYGASEFHKVA